MSIKCCDTTVKTKFCPHCGKEVNGDNLVLKWIASCETALKYWVEKINATPTLKEDDPNYVKDQKCLDNANKMEKMWRKRIEILKSTMKGSE